MYLRIDGYTDSINKFGEELCGEKVEIIRSEEGIVAILAGGKGSGVKANIQASLTTKMLATMIEQSECIEDAVIAIVETLPVDTFSDYYATFAVIQIFNNGKAYIAEMGRPAAVFLRRGHVEEIEMQEKSVGDKVFRHGSFTLKYGDTLTAFSEGVVKVGMDSILKNVWRRELAVAYLQAAYKPRITAQKLTNLLLSVSSSLYQGKPIYDLSVLTFQVSETDRKSESMEE